MTPKYNFYPENSHICFKSNATISLLYYDFLELIFVILVFSRRGEPGQCYLLCDPNKNYIHRCARNAECRWANTPGSDLRQGGTVGLKTRRYLPRVLLPDWSRPTW